MFSSFPKLLLVPVPAWNCLWISDSIPGQAGILSRMERGCNRWRKRLLLCLHFSGCFLDTSHTQKPREDGAQLSVVKGFFFFPPMNNFSSTPPEQRSPRCGGELSSGNEVLLLGGVCLSVCLSAELTGLRGEHPSHSALARAGNVCPVLLRC